MTFGVDLNFKLFSKLQIFNNVGIVSSDKKCESCIKCGIGVNCGGNMGLMSSGRLLIVWAG